MSFGNQEFEELKDWKVNLEFDVVRSLAPPKTSPKYLGIVTIPFPGNSVRDVHYQIFGAMSAPSHFSGFVGLRTDFSNIEDQERPLITEGQITSTNNRRIVFDIDDPRQDYFVLVRYLPKEMVGGILGPKVGCVSSNTSDTEPAIKNAFISSPLPRQLFSIFYTSKLIEQHKNAMKVCEEHSQMTSRYSDFFPAPEPSKRFFIAKNRSVEDEELEESSSDLTPTSEDDDEAHIDAFYQALLEKDPRSYFRNQNVKDQTQ